jgi:hypothetical protein
MKDKRKRNNFDQSHTIWLDTTSVSFEGSKIAIFKKMDIDLLLVTLQWHLCLAQVQGLLHFTLKTTTVPVN